MEKLVFILIWRIVLIVVVITTVDCSTSPPKEICADRFVEALPYPPRCDWFVICVMSRPIFSLCDRNEIFDPETRICVPGNIETCEKQTSLTTIPTEPTTIPTEPTTIPTEPTTIPTEPTTIPTEPTTIPTEPTTIPTEPTTIPTEPTTIPTEPTTIPTEPTTIPTEPTTITTEPTTIPTEPTTILTEPTTIPTEPTTIPTEPTTIPTEPTTPPPKIVEMCLGKDFGNLPHPNQNQCAVYIQCLFQTAVVRYCPRNRIFDRETLECVPGNQETCEKNY